MKDAPVLLKPPTLSPGAIRVSAAVAGVRLVSFSQVLNFSGPRHMFAPCRKKQGLANCRCFERSSDHHGYFTLLYVSCRLTYVLFHMCAILLGVDGKSLLRVPADRSHRCPPAAFA